MRTFGLAGFKHLSTGWKVSIVLGCLLVASTSYAVVSTITYNNLRKRMMLEDITLVNFSSREEFEKSAYNSPDEWLWRPEARGISRMRDSFAPGKTPQLSNLLEQWQKRASVSETVVSMLSWYEQNRWQVAKSYFPVFADESLYCDENAAIFRSMLMRVGIQSRVVNFQFDDGDGGGSHTALEVWRPREAKWMYVDPHYNAYSLVDTLRTADDLSTLSRLTPELKDVFTNGMKELVIEGHAPRTRIIYRRQG